MKNLFPEYDDVSQIDFDEVWKDGLFVFDTNVLLNLYRYNVTTRTELMQVIEKLSNQIWIPFHVALEYQRNRQGVIAEQNKRFSDVKKLVSEKTRLIVDGLNGFQLDKRHSLINPSAYIHNLNEIEGEFLSELKELAESQQKITGADPIKSKLEAVFEGKVGESPKDQASVDKLNKSAELRFRVGVPPGFEDSKKNNSVHDEFMYDGIVYRRSCGDYYVWSQLLDKAKSNEVTSVVLVTDDVKKDWWSIVECEGPKLIGPRPELVREAMFVSNIKRLVMYKTEDFLKYAKKYIKVEVSESTLQEVRDVAVSQRNINIESKLHKIVEKSRRQKNSVKEWLYARYVDVSDGDKELVDFVVHEHGKKIGYKVLLNGFNNYINIGAITGAMAMSYSLLNLKVDSFDEVTVVVVLDNDSVVSRVMREIENRITLSIPTDRLHVLIGAVSFDQSFGRYDFKLLHEVDLSVLGNPDRVVENPSQNTTYSIRPTPDLEIDLDHIG